MIPLHEWGRYQIFGEIARGGMGAILRGRDRDLGRDLAVKVLLEDHRDRPELAGDDPAKWAAARDAAQRLRAPRRRP